MPPVVSIPLGLLFYYFYVTVVGRLIGQVKAPNQILRKGAKKNRARCLAIYLARELSGESGVDLRKYFGSICGAAVTGRYKQISEQISRNRRLKDSEIFRP